MIKAKHIAAFLFFFYCSHLFCYPPGVNGRGFRLGFGPCLGFYSINTNHAQALSPKMSALIGLKKEVRADRQFKMFFLFGADYFFHGVNFRSYYFSQDTLQIYDKNFAHDYSVFFHEVNVPLQMKYSFTRENNSLYSPYAIIGYHFRFFMPAHVKVGQEGNVIRDEWEEVQFRTSLIDKHVNAFMSAGVGFQKNTINNSRSGFFAELNFRYGFSSYFFKTNYSASSLYVNGTHVCLLLGIKF
jgi:hypothetical protein